MPFTAVLDAIPSTEVRDLVTEQLAAGCRVKIDYQGNPGEGDGGAAPSGGQAPAKAGGKVTITVIDANSKKKVTRLHWA